MAVAVAVGLPRPSEAGFFSALVKLFAPAQAEVEETLLPTLPGDGPADSQALEATNRPPAAPGEESISDANPLTVIQESALLAPLNPLGTMPSGDGHAAGQIFVYTVRPGDTLSSIAKSFDVSVNTILWANNISSTRSLTVGSQLVILPVSGVRHEVKKGDTISSIAKKYRASVDDIAEFNSLAPDESIAVGSVVVVPNGELAQSVPLTAGATQPRSFASLPQFNGYYLRPILGGRRSRGIHGYNGVDLANSCGLAVLAAADGTVLISKSSGWNGGYGRYIVVAHPNNTQTLYAHLKELFVQPGQTVRQGNALGTIGSSGNSTGCHVHFEVRGAKNPF